MKLEAVLTEDQVISLRETRGMLKAIARLIETGEEVDGALALLELIRESLWEICEDVESRMRPVDCDAS